MSKVFKNTNWLLFERLLSMPINLGVGILLARLLGPDDFGSLNFLLAMMALLTPIVQFGLNALVTREILNSTKHSDHVLLHCVTVRAVAAVCGLSILLLLVICFDWFDVPNQTLFFLLAFSQLFVAFEVVIYWFESQVNMKPIVLIRLLCVFIFAVFKVSALLLDASLSQLVWIFAIEIAVLNSALLMVYLYSNPKRIQSISLDIEYIKKLVKQSSWLILSSVAAIVYLKIDQVMLGYLATEADVGVYAVAVRLSEVWYFLPIALVSSFYPSLITAKKTDLQQYNVLLTKLMAALFWAGFALALFISTVSPWLINLLYGDAYQQSAIILSIHVWAGVFIFVRALLSKWLIIENILPFSLLTQGMGCLVNIVLNFWLIPEYAGIGAAWATLISYAAATWLALFLHKKTFKMACLMAISPVKGMYYWVQR